MKAGKLGIIAVFWLLLVSASANMVWPFVKDIRLMGAFTPAPRPGWKVSSFLKGNFQKEFEDWYNSNFGFRGYAVRLDSTLSFYAFRDVPVGSQARIGRDGMLFSFEDIIYLNRKEWPTAQEDLQARARLAREVHDLLAARGIKLLILVAPSKTSIYRNAVTPALVGKYADSDRGVYEKFVAALRQERVPFVDARAFLASWRPEDVFSPYARHWSFRAACAVLNELLRVAALPGTSQVSCEVVGHTKHRGGPDFDLWTVLNAWRLTPFEYDEEVLAPVPPPPGPRPKVLFEGSSFVYTITDGVDRTRVVDFDFYYYNRSHWLHSMVPGPLKPNTPAWIANALAKDLIVVEVLETYLPDLGTGLLDQLKQALTQPQIQAVGPR